jgi:hypothetical protein
VSHDEGSYLKRSAPAICAWRVEENLLVTRTAIAKCRRHSTVVTHDEEISGNMRDPHQEHNVIWTSFTHVGRINEEQVATHCEFL